MSEVLLKKIRSATGMPQNVLQMQAFWAELRALAGDWSLATFGVETRSLFDIRRIISGKAAREMLISGTNFAFPADTGSGLAAVLFEEDCVIACASNRLGETPDAMASASKVFLKLLCEDAARALRMRVTGAFDAGLPAAYATPTEDFSKVAGFLDPSSRYLLIRTRMPLPDKSVQLSLLFFLDHIHKLAERQSMAAADRRARSYLQTPDTLRKSVRSSVISIDAVLGRIPMTIGECSRLATGQVLALSPEPNAQVTLTAETLSGRQTLCGGSMGVVKQSRAIRLSSSVSAAFLANIGDL